MPQVVTRCSASHLRRLMAFTEPRRDDVCLDVAIEGPGLAPALDPWVAEVATSDLAVLAADQGEFTLVTSLLSVSRTPDPVTAVRDMLGALRADGRLILADLVRTRITAGPRDRIERLRDPAHTTTRTIDDLIALVAQATGDIRRLDVFTIERPIGPWLAQASDPAAAERIRDELMEELDGGPATGTRPRLVGGELWFTQSWAHIAARRTP